MCLILFAVNPNDKYRLVVAANRDELHARPTINAGFWPENDNLLAGKDKNAGGTWLGVSRSGRFAAVTNFREVPPDPIPPRSRGDLPLNFLEGQMSSGAYTQEISTRGDAYRGFNLLTADNEEFYYYCNREGRARSLPNGFYGLSNQVLDCDWPKVNSGRDSLASLIETEDQPALTESLFELLLDGGDEREFSNSFILGEEYGTRAATVVLMTNDGDVYFEERNFGAGGTAQGGNQYSFRSTSDS